MCVVSKNNVRNILINIITSTIHYVKYNAGVPCAQCAYNSVRVQCLDQGLEPSDNKARERKQYSASDHTIGKRQLRTDTIRQ